MTIGVTIRGVAPLRTVELIEEADRLGVDAVWLQAGGIAPDPLTLFAAAARRTERVRMGAAILPTWPRHPLAVVQQVTALEALAPGRLRLGVGPSTAGGMRPFGVDFRRPLAELREYLVALQSLLKQGTAEMDGEYVRVRARVRPTGTPVMASALQAGAFELCGELADAAITWLCPPDYVREAGIPALRRGAERAGRTVPPVVLHVPICRETDRRRVVEAASRMFGAYTTFQFYRDMFAAAGHPPLTEPVFSPELVDALVVYGTDDRVRHALAQRLGDGVEELMITPIPTGDASEAVLDAMRLVGGGV